MINTEKKAPHDAIEEITEESTKRENHYYVDPYGHVKTYYQGGGGLVPKYQTAGNSTSTVKKAAGRKKRSAQSSPTPQKSILKKRS